MTLFIGLEQQSLWILGAAKNKLLGVTQIYIVIETVSLIEMHCVWYGLIE
jgi:hypothetical protein